MQLQYLLNIIEFCASHLILKRESLQNLALADSAAGILMSPYSTIETAAYRHRIATPPSTTHAGKASAGNPKLFAKVPELGFRIAHRCHGQSNFGGRNFIGQPPLRPRARAEISPAFVRSDISSRSSSDNAAKMPKTSLPPESSCRWPSLGRSRPLVFSDKYLVRRSS